MRDLTIVLCSHCVLSKGENVETVLSPQTRQVVVGSSSRLCMQLIVSYVVSGASVSVYLALGIVPGAVVICGQVRQLE